MVKIFGIKNCNSMKKAFDALTAAGIAYEFHDYKKQGIDAATVERWLNDLGAEQVLNKKGTTWRKLDDAQQAHALSSQAALIETLTTHSSLIKRPIIESEHSYVVGFDAEKIQALAK